MHGKAKAGDRETDGGSSHADDADVYGGGAVPQAVEYVIPVRTRSEANQRQCWQAVASRKRQQRATACIATKIESDYIRTVFRNRRRLVITMTRVSPRLLDDDNVASALKAVRDGIADALGADDGPNSPLKFVATQRKGSPQVVEVRVERRAD